MNLITNCLLLFYFVSFDLLAGPFAISNRNLGTDPTKTAQINSLFDSIETKVNGNLPESNGSKYLKATANSNVMSGKGIGQDYSNPIIFTIFKISAGIGADLGDHSLNDLVSGSIEPKNVNGVGFQGGIMIGVDLNSFGAGKAGPIDFSKSEIFFNYGVLNAKDVSSDFKGEMNNFGFHFRYQLAAENEFIPFGGFKFGGLFFHTGYEFNKMNLNLSTSSNYSFTESGIGTMSIAGDLSLGVNSETHTIPFEISTYFDYLLVATSFFGVGLDYNFGFAKSKATLNAPISYSADATVSGTGALNLGSEESPTPIIMRGFFGQQFNFSIFKITATLNKAFNEDVWGVNLGLSITY